MYDACEKADQKVIAGCIEVEMANNQLNPNNITGVITQANR